MRSHEVNFCPRCGQAVIREMRHGQVRPVCPACNWAHFVDPKVAAAMLVEQDGRVLLVQRVNEPGRGLWTLPAGFVDGGEDPARAAERECLEETGLTIRAVELLDIFAGLEHSRGADFVIFYRGQVTGGRLCAGDDAGAVEWFERGDLPGLAFQSTAYILSK